MIVNHMSFSVRFVSQCKNLVQTLKWYRIMVIKFMSIHLCCVFHLVSFQTTHGFDIRIGPVSFNLTSYEKDTPLLFQLVSDRYHFFYFDAAINGRLNWASFRRRRKRLKSD